MMGQKRIWLESHLDARTPRERLLILVCVLVVLYLIFDALAFRPLYASLQTQSSLLEEKKQTHLALKQTQAYEKKHLKAKFSLLEREIKDAKMQLKKFGAQNADHASDLKVLLSNQPGLTLEALQTQTPIQEGEGVYRIPVTISFSGGYLEVMAFLKTLETLKQLRMIRLSYEVKAHPISEVQLEAEWIRSYRGFVEFKS